ncbi:hypothetical protein Ocin01_03028 [Orchesella cincta]|uniref:Uncharacterized protein n=1 Tax=Orchesella cincta TaxID=48709 RepID=A0A1D2NEF5_ORCCI|nr:hypothetical protein Ocin01_03028 [Orchesella cincta]
MESKLLSILILIFVSFCLIQIQAFRQPKCRGKETKLTPDELKTMSDCMKQFAGKSNNMSQIPKDSMGCVGKCILQKQGLVNDKGAPVKENIFAMVNATMEPDVAKEADEKLGKCIDEKCRTLKLKIFYNLAQFMAGGIDVNEKACQTYWPLVECVATAFMQICMMNSTNTNVKT